MADTTVNFRRLGALLYCFALDSNQASRRVCAATHTIQSATSSAGHWCYCSSAGHWNSLPERVYWHSFPFCCSDGCLLLAAASRRTLEHQRFIGSDVLALWVVSFQLKRRHDSSLHLVRQCPCIPAILPCQWILDSKHAGIHWDCNRDGIYELGTRSGLGSNTHRSQARVCLCGFYPGRITVRRVGT